MTKQNIEQLISQNEFPEINVSIELIETHISWVIVGDNFVYKIKKPIQYSFLNFSTLNNRKFYCHREIELNRRLTEDVYLDVQPVKQNADIIFIGSGAGEVIDYAVRMHKLPAGKRMDKLLRADNVSPADIKRLTEKICRFHQQTNVVKFKPVAKLQEEFNDLSAQKRIIEHDPFYKSLIENAIEVSNSFISRNEALLQRRIQNGYVRDCHGDLHSRNIFLLPDPQPFDCIEFNDELREIDVLNEIAFLCMDLEAFNRRDLANLFIEHYLSLSPVMQTPEEKLLFVYYKAYRANIRAKVNILRAGSAVSSAEKKHASDEMHKYLLLMNDYILAVETGSV